MTKFLRRSPRRLIVFVAVALFVIATMTTAQANILIWLGSGEGGETFLSCGSSAGNYMYTCNSSGCTGMSNDPANQIAADMMCRELGYGY